jgi:hypothetical protein
MSRDRIIAKKFVIFINYYGTRTTFKIMVLFSKIILGLIPEEYGGISEGIRHVPVHLFNLGNLS